MKVGNKSRDMWLSWDIVAKEGISALCVRTVVHSALWKAVDEAFVGDLQ